MLSMIAAASRPESASAMPWFSARRLLISPAKRWAKKPTGRRSTCQRNDPESFTASFARNSRR